MKRVSLSGFTLIETMLALLVAALTIVPLTQLVTSVVTRITKDSELLYADNRAIAFLADARLQAGQKTEFSLTKEQEGLILRYQRTVDREKSPFFTKYLMREVVSAFFKDIDGKEKLRTEFVTFVFLPPPEKAETAKTEQPKEEKEKTKENAEPKGKEKNA
jgi:type II secretory pathway pseudopilin PulG